ncbi:MAG: diguanylate cyclase [Spirulina sp. SIO3F2]|nr:diguanylate cyclase [Spirulina sp. SIO3F2]
MTVQFQDLLPPCLEFITCDRQLQITGWSPGVLPFITTPLAPDTLEATQDIRDWLPELVGLEDTIEQLFRGEKASFELSGIQHQDDYLDLLIVCESEGNITTSSKHILILIRNASDRMAVEQHLGQIAKEYSLKFQELSLAQNYLKQIVSSMSDALLVTDHHGRIQQINPATTEILGYTESELLHKPIQTLFTKLPQSNTLPNKFPNFLLGQDIEQYCQSKDDQILSLSFSCSSFQQSIDQTMQYVCIGRDISLRKQMERYLEDQVRSSRLVSNLTQHLQKSLTQSDLLQTTTQLLYQWLVCDRVLIAHYNPDGSGAIVASTASELFIRPNHQIIPAPENSEQSVEYLQTALSTVDIKSQLAIPLFEEQHLWGLLIIHYCEREHNWKRQEIHLLEQVAGQVGMALERCELYQQLQQANAELRRLAHIDGLTQLGNRRAFDQQLQTEWEQAQQTDQSLSLILCDVDFFKAYNDYYGHPQGDYCLQLLGQILISICHNTVFFPARYGGEEFVLLMPNTNQTQASRIAQTIHQALASQALKHERSTLEPWVTISIGGITFQPTVHTWQAQDLVSRADQALYDAKKQGRNCSRFWTTD